MYYFYFFRSDNFDTIHFYQKKVRMLRLYETLENISKIAEGQEYKVGNNVLAHLMMNWNGPPEKYKDETLERFGPSEHYKLNPLSSFVLKNFAANLIKLILRKKESAKEHYFLQYPNIEVQLKQILLKLNSYLEENREK